MAPREGQTSRRRGLWRPILLLAVIATILVLTQVFGVGEKLGVVRDWIRGLGALGPVAFVVLYAVAAVAALPGSVLTVAAGALFGSVLGVITVSIAATFGASLSFLIARYFARDAVGRWLSTKEKFRKLDQMTEEHGAVVVALTRLVPLFPFNLLNYGFGLTRVRFWTYVFWSWLCMLPGTVLYVVGADAVFKGITQGRLPWGLIVVVAAAVVVLVVVVRYARRRLQEKEAGR